MHPTAPQTLFARRSEPTRLLRDAADDLVSASAAMARRFRAGGALFVLARGTAASDSAHVAVEFIHPVLVGKRALPARFVETPELLPLLAREGDLVLVMATGEVSADVRDALSRARRAGALAVALTGDDPTGDDPTGLDADFAISTHGDRLVAQELQVTCYHLLWELVHVCLEQGDLVAPLPAQQAACDQNGHCMTCSDEAVAVRVTALLDDQRALVATETGIEEVSVALVDAEVGQTILVHAREAIGVVPS